MARAGLPERPSTILGLLASSAVAMCTRDVSAALGGKTWEEDEKNRAALYRLCRAGLATKSGSYIKYFGLTDKGRMAAGLEPGAPEQPTPKKVHGRPFGRATMPNEPAMFDAVRFGKAFRDEIQRRDVSQATVAGEIGVSAVALGKILDGGRPSVETYLRTLRWMGVTKIAVNAFAAAASDNPVSQQES